MKKPLVNPATAEMPEDTLKAVLGMAQMRAMRREIQHWLRATFTRTTCRKASALYAWALINCVFVY